jgi:hypothetical protein
MKAALPGSATIAKPPGANPVRLVLIAVVAAIVIGLIWQMLHRENAFESVAQRMTAALARNDFATVETYQNAETATHVTRGIVGHDADLFAPLGNVKKAKETAVDGATHQFDVTFDKGVVHETIKFDPAGKVVNFHFTMPSK